MYPGIMRIHFFLFLLDPAGTHPNASRDIILSTAALGMVQGGWSAQKKYLSVSGFYNIKGCDIIDLWYHR